MSTEVVAYETASLTARREYAATLASAGQLIPKGLFDNATGKPSPGKILLVMETGSMLGLHPMAALQSINVVEGRATLAAQLMSALIRKAGHRLEIRKTGSITTGDYAVTVVGTRADTGDVFQETWDIPRAMRAGLVDSYQRNAQGVWEVRARSEKGNKPKPWEAYAEAMPKWRAVSDVAREGFSDITLGLYSYEEMTDGGFPIAEPDPEPTEDWLALFAAAQSREELNAIGERLAEKGEGTDKLRIAFQARAGVLAREANTVDADVIEDDPTEVCMVCQTTGPAGFECPHPDAHTPLPTAAQDANGEPSTPRNDPPPAWRSMIAGASLVDGVAALRARAEGAGWLTTDVAAALDAREAELREEAARAEDYDERAAAEFDAAAERGEVPGV